MPSPPAAAPAPSPAASPAAPPAAAPARSPALTRTGLGAAGALLLAGAALAPVLGPLAALPAAATAAGAVLTLLPDPRLRPAAPVAAALSLLATAEGLRGARPLDGRSSVVLLELGALLLLVVLTARDGRPGAALLAGAAASCWFLRFGGTGPESLPAVGFWALVALLAAAGGGYLRGLDRARARAVDGARRSQRLELARDLHDFVAHDVSEMLALAQAGRYVCAPDAPAAEVFGRIEHAAQQALAAMDRTVRMLHDEPPAPDRRPLPTLADLPGLADRFAAAHAAAVRLDLDARLVERLPREVSATAYRVAVESLTNVRRHAPGTDGVELTVRQLPGPAVEIAVRNESGGVPAPRERGGGGLGLVQLAERVGALGGTLDAGPLAPGGWRTAAVLPLHDRRIGGPA